MKKRLIGYLLIIGILTFGLMSYRQSPRIKSLLPHLPYPIAREKVLVTPAGQGTEGLIISELCDVLNIRNHYMYWAEPQDLEGYNTLVLVLGFSKQGLYSIHKNPEEEIQRVKSLVTAADKKGIPVILLHIGGQDRRSQVDDQTAGMIASMLDYIIVTQEGEWDGFFTGLATGNKIPLTVVKDIQEIKVPFNSVFR